MSDTLTKGEVAVLNAARDILAAHKEGYPDDYGQARTIVFAEQAEQAIFEYLNNASTWGKAALTHEQIHGYPAPEPVAEIAAVPAPQSVRA